MIEEKLINVTIMLSYAIRFLQEADNEFDEVLRELDKGNYSRDLYLNVSELQHETNQAKCSINEKIDKIREIIKCQ